MNFHLVSLGCDKNLVDSEVMLGVIAENGHNLVSDPAEAEIIVVNTCGFIAPAVKEGIQSVLEMARQKAEGRCRALVVTGCMAERYRDQILAEFPEVDAVVGAGAFREVGQAVEDALRGHSAEVILSDKTVRPDEALAGKRVLSGAGYMAYLKIAEGCDNRCAYCTIPSIRGPYRSRTMESLIAEAEALARRGARELILVAQDTAQYGVDLYGKSVLHELAAGLSKIDGIAWIRVMYAYPEYITDEFVAEMAANPKICHYLDMPVQHCDDGVLRRMGRRSASAGLDAIIAKLRREMPDICLRTTLITGFPGETEEEFGRLREFVERTRFDRLGVFAYSREEGTRAYKMSGQLGERVKKRRRDEILSLQSGISREINETYIGKTLKVIVDGSISHDGTPFVFAAPEETGRVYCGRSYRDSYEVDGMVFFTSEEELLSGEFVDAEIVGVSEYDLMGRLREK
ncbi:MAG: 30S ribosomal protein S12 methylthiotransferase RimO [Defluviitaleaceae bacterium]|nr:30S ribosomal protein S12 methylthiotransferase RimO [Defluviitaleaceae bacterium]